MLRYAPAILGAIASISLVMLSVSTGRANHAPAKHAAGAGFGNLLGAERGFAYVGYGALPSSWQAYAKTAVADWKAVTSANVAKDGVRLAPTGPDVQIDVVRTGYASVFDTHFGQTCQDELAQHSSAYAWTDALDVNHNFVNDANQNGWWDAAELTKPFAIARACLNAGKSNNKGTVAHEIGHALGLNHPIYNGGSCPDRGLDSIMAYNYTAWRTLWPSSLSATTADVVGPWVCDTSYAAGTNWVYDFGVTNSRPAPAYFVVASNPSGRILRACFYDQSSAETAYFLKAWRYPGTTAEGGFVSSVAGTNGSACREWTVAGGQFYHVEMLSYSGVTSQFSVGADQYSPAWWIYIP